jgi:hypothetical protein
MLHDTTWSEKRVDPKLGARHCFSLWFNEWFTEALEPSARGGFEGVESYPSGWAVTSCKECGALVLHDGTHHEDSVVHLNAHRSFHDKIDDLLGERWEA